MQPEDPSIKLLDYSARSNETKLKSAQKAASETEYIGLHVYDQLRQQREQLERASVTLIDADTEVGRSNHLLGRMIHRHADLKSI